MKNRWKDTAIVLFIFVLGLIMPVSADATFKTDQIQSGSEKSNTVTIYLDRKNQTSIRMAVAMYEREKTSDDPDIEWNLVDKSAMDPEEFQKSLAEELYQGGGPDILFIDEDSAADPWLWMRNGLFMDITDFFLDVQEKSGLEFYPAVLEACSLGGYQYLVPLSIQTPVLFADREALEVSGFTDVCPDTYAELLHWAADYQADNRMCSFDADILCEELFLHSGIPYIDYETGKICILEKELEALCDAYRYIRNTSGDSDPQESCCMTDAPTQICDHTSKITAQDTQAAFSPYERISDGSSLFSTSGMGDYNRMAANIRVLYANGQDIVFQKLPTMQGEVQTIITHAVGINQNSEQKELALTALEAFLSYHAMTEGQTGQGLPAVSNQGYWDVEFCYKVLSTTEWPDKYYQMDTMDPFTGADNLLDAYEEIAGFSITKAVFSTGITKTGGLAEQCMKGYINGTQSFEESITILRQELESWIKVWSDKNADCALTEDISENTEVKVINVMYADHCLGTSHPLYQLLQDAAAKIRENGVHVNLIASWNPQPELYYGWMVEAGVEPDLILCGESAMTSELIVSRENQYYDMTNIQNMEELCSSGILKNASVKGVLQGIPYAADIMGLWCRKDLLEAAGISVTEYVLSFAELSEIAAVIQEENLAEVPIYIQQSPSAMQAILQNTGEKFFDMDSNQVLVNCALWKQAADWLHTLGQKDLAETVSQKEASEALKNGKTAIFLGYGSFLSMYQEDGSLPWEDWKENVVYLPLPGINSDVSAYTMTDMNLFFVGKNTENIESVLYYMKLCFQSDFYEIMLDKMQMVSCRASDDSIYNKALENAVSKSYSDQWPYHPLRNLLVNIVKAEKNAEDIYTAFENDIRFQSDF